MCLSTKTLPNTLTKRCGWGREKSALFYLCPLRIPPPEPCREGSVRSSINKMLASYTNKQTEKEARKKYRKMSHPPAPHVVFVICLPRFSFIQAMVVQSVECHHLSATCLTVRHYLSAMCLTSLSICYISFCL